MRSPERVALDTPLGWLSGLRWQADGASKHVSRFAGIPYARPPVGARRFRAAEPAGGWQGERDAAAPALAQPQTSGGVELVPGMVPAATGDDSLSLTIWTPDGARARPVMVWIHGGSFTIGASSLPSYDAARLAADGDVVVVAINYRLGALGWMALGAHGGDEWGAIANCGLLDQAAALRWVREHIAAYGGDAGNVTVFGESAGGGSILHLLASPAGRGLCERAIVQSGSTGRTLSADQSSAVAHAVLEELGLGRADQAALEGLTSEQIVAAQERATPKLFAVAGMLPFHPALDDATLPLTPLDALRAGNARDVDVLLGVTTDEMRLFLEGPALEPERLHARTRRYFGLDDAATSTLLDSYRELLGAARGGAEAVTPIDVWAAIFSDREMVVPAVAALDAHAASGGRSFGYVFDWPARPRGDGLELGACHGVDIPFTFATFSVDGWDAFVGADADAQAAEALSAALRASWCGFARTGDPAHEGVGSWPAYRPAERATMRLGRRPGVEFDPAAARLAALAAAGVEP
ncbi:MAG: para-nitrobenzyl esterase [Actinomycetota bacterium]|jgi:para-nitrobenzyl esterase|nr:para-nitrobenzyl esterase [Actinomycetota bacterium]